MPSSGSDLLPLFPLGAALVPGMELPLHIFEERYRRLMSDRRGADPIFGVVLIRAGREVADHPVVFRVGTAASVVDATEHEDGRSSIVVRGGRRFAVGEEDWSTGYLTATVDWLDEPEGDVRRCRELAIRAADRWRKFVAALARLVGDRDEVDAIADQIVARLPGDPTERCYAIIGQLPVPATTRQRLLELATTENRLQTLIDLLESERKLMTALGTMPTLSYATNRPMETN
jgi:Lon protease-like protein